jgi:hypothetical protein
MKRLFLVGILTVIIISLFSCHTTKKIINKAIAPKDSIVTVITNHSLSDSLLALKATVTGLNSHYIDFKTFSAKIKAEYEDNNGKKPELTAIVHIVKDSAIWISLSASFLNVEVYRMLITKDSVFLMNIQDKEAQFRSLDYLQDVTDIPFDYKTLQDLLIGNPIFLDSNIVSYKRTNDRILISTAGPFFKNLLTLSTDDYLLMHSKLDDVDLTRNRTADITYQDFENNSGIGFSTYREIIVSEKNKLDIRLNFKRYEFNKELSVSFNIPKNYKRK